MKNLFIGCLVAALMGLFARSVAKTPSTVPVLLAAPAPLQAEFGLASWYGLEFHGNTTANGEVYDINGLTAAHRDLPMGTKVRVTNVTNKRSVTVRINDRGPKTPGRLIDVSMEAAKNLDLLRAGIAPVEVVVLTHRNITPTPDTWQPVAGSISPTSKQGKPTFPPAEGQSYSIELRQLLP